MAWTLYVDESGDFTDPSDFGVVAGILLPGPPDGRLHRELREQLEAALPGMPWPPHTAELNRPVSRLLAASNLAYRKRPASVADTIERLRPMLDDADLRDHDTVRDLDNRLRRRHPRAYDLARALQAEQDAMLDGIARDLAKLGAVAMAAAAPMDLEPGRKPPGDSILRDPYIRLLGLLLARIHALLAHRQAGVEVVHALIANRGITLTTHPMPVPFQGLYQQEIIAEAARTPVLPAGDPLRNSVRIVPTGARQRYFRDDCPAGLFLADWIAYHARHALQGRHGDWNMVRTGLSQRLGLPLHRRPATWPGTTRGLPTVAAGGDAQARVADAARLGDVLPCDDLGPPAWIAGATAPWIRAAAKGWKP